MAAYFAVARARRHHPCDEPAAHGGHLTHGSRVNFLRQVVQRRRLWRREGRRAHRLRRGGTTSRSSTGPGGSSWPVPPRIRGSSTSTRSAPSPILRVGAVCSSRTWPITSGSSPAAPTRAPCPRRTSSPARRTRSCVVRAVACILCQCRRIRPGGRQGSVPNACREAPSSTQSRPRRWRSRRRRRRPSPGYAHQVVANARALAEALWPRAG